MNEAQEQEAYRRITAAHSPYAIARELADQTRVQGITEPIPRGFPVASYWAGSLIYEGYYLKPDYFLALCYEERHIKDPDPFTERGLKHCQAWIFQYDRQHSHLNMKAHNTSMGNRSFSQLAHRMATE